jgi:hypothetical protein
MSDFKLLNLIPIDQNLGGRLRNANFDTVSGRLHRSSRYSLSGLAVKGVALEDGGISYYFDKRLLKFMD